MKAGHISKSGMNAQRCFLSFSMAPTRRPSLSPTPVKAPLIWPCGPIAKKWDRPLTKKTLALFLHSSSLLSLSHLEQGWQLTNQGCCAKLSVHLQSVQRERERERRHVTHIFICYHFILEAIVHLQQHMDCIQCNHITQPWLLYTWWFGVLIFTHTLQTLGNMNHPKKHTDMHKKGRGKIIGNVYYNSFHPEYPCKWGSFQENYF